jgi:hypothetical protein
VINRYESNRELLRGYLQRPVYARSDKSQGGAQNLDRTGKLEGGVQGVQP